MVKWLVLAMCCLATSALAQGASTREERQAKAAMLPVKNSPEWMRLMAEPPLGDWVAYKNDSDLFFLKQEYPVSPVTVESGMHMVSVTCSSDSKLSFLFDTDKKARSSIWLNRGGEGEELKGTSGQMKRGAGTLIRGRAAIVLAKALVEAETYARKSKYPRAAVEINTEGDVSGPPINAANFTTLMRDKLPKCARSVGL